MQRCYIVLPSCRPTTRRRSCRGRVHCASSSSQAWGPCRSNPRLLRLTTGTWNFTSLVWKEPELVCNVDRSRLDIVGLTSIHRSGSGTSLLKRGWTFFQFGAVLNKRQWRGVGILVSLGLLPVHVEALPLDKGLFPCVFGEWVLTLWLPFESHWMGCFRVLHLMTPLSYWETSIHMSNASSDRECSSAIGLLCK